MEQKAELLKIEIQRGLRKKLERSYQFLKLSREMDETLVRDDSEIFSLLLEQRNSLILLMEELDEKMMALFQQYKQEKNMESATEIADLGEEAKRLIKETKLNLRESFEIDERIRSLVVS